MNKQLSFDCAICEKKVESNGYMVGLKEAFVRGNACILRMCADCYTDVANGIISLKKQWRNQSDAKDEEPLPKMDDDEFWRSLGIKYE